MPADVAANSDDAQAEIIPAHSLITGNSVAVGGIKAAPNTVMGQIIANAQPTSLPILDITQFDPLTLNYPPNVVASGELPAQTMSGYNRAFGSVHINGNLQLNGGVLYVDGNLNVDGAVSGSGAVFATGSQSFGHGGSFASTNMIALAAIGDISLQGSNADNDSFQGLLYTQGNLNIQRLSLLGEAVAAGPSSDIIMDESKVAAFPQYGQITMTVQGVNTSPAQAAQPFALSGGTAYGGSATNVAHLSGAGASGGQITASLSPSVGTNGLPVTPLPHGPIIVQGGGGAGGAVRGTVTGFSGGVLNVQVSGKQNMAQIIVTDMGSGRVYKSPWLHTDSDPTGKALSWLRSANLLTDLEDATSSSSDEGPLASFIASLIAALPADNPQQQITQSQQPTGTATITIDLAQFLTVADRVRLVMWHQI